MAELSGFEVLALVKEIDLALRGTYVNNIYRLGASQLVRFRRQGAEDSWLVVSSKKGVWLSSKVSERADTTEFTSRLRGELERGRFIRASQAGLDRVFVLEFEAESPRKLIVELMPPGNLVVTDAEGKIVLASREVRSGPRKVSRGAVYQTPRQTRIVPSEVTPDDVSEMVRAEKTAGRAIGRHVALPRKYVAECLGRLGLEEGTPSSELAGREGELCGVLKEMVAEAGSPNPCVCELDGAEEICAFPPRGLKVVRSAGSVSELCDALLLREATAEPEPPSPEAVRRGELEATIAGLKAESASLLARASEARSAAEEARGLPLGEALTLVRKYAPTPGSGPSSPAAASSALFDYAKGLALKSSQDLESARRLEGRLSRITVTKGPGTKPIQRKKREWYEKFRWFHTSGGKLAIGGRDAQTNAALIARHLDENDTVYHADLFGSPFFVLKGGKGQTPDEVRQVAQATVAFSSAWKTALGAADAYWVTPDQVSSAAPSGEYLARGSFSIRGKKNFVPKVLVEIAVSLDGEGRVLAGPEEAVMEWGVGYLVLRPQREKGSDTAKHVARELPSVAGGVSGPPPLDEVQRALPSGGGKVVRRRTKGPPSV